MVVQKMLIAFWNQRLAWSVFVSLSIHLSQYLVTGPPSLLIITKISPRKKWSRSYVCQIMLVAASFVNAIVALITCSGHESFHIVIACRFSPVRETMTYIPYILAALSKLSSTHRIHWCHGKRAWSNHFISYYKEHFSDLPVFFHGSIPNEPHSIYLIRTYFCFQ